MPRERSGFVDLHAHTTASDGTLSPAELVAAAVHSGLDALAITDHDTFRGYEAAMPVAQEAGLDLVCGIELNSRLELENGRHRAAHILVYFPDHGPQPRFLEWLHAQQEDRRNRNNRLVESLRSRGLSITLEEVEDVGRSMTGRPHFARILVKKGYAADSEDAFRRYIGESAPAYVERQSPAAEDVIALARAGGGIPVVAHPVRLNLPHETLERKALGRLKNAGLVGLEVRHSEHPPDLQDYYERLSRELDLLPTGGSDFHGGIKPDIDLGTGRDGNIRVPESYLAQLRAWGTSHSLTPAS